MATYIIFIIDSRFVSLRIANGACVFYLLPLHWPGKLLGAVAMLAVLAGLTRLARLECVCSFCLVQHGDAMERHGQHGEHGEGESRPRAKAVSSPVSERLTLMAKFCRFVVEISLFAIGREFCIWICYFVCCYQQFCCLFIFSFSFLYTTCMFYPIVSDALFKLFIIEN